MELGKLEHLDARKLWLTEAGHFTPWLAQNLTLLGEALGLDLELIGTEQDVGDFACDLHARDAGRDRPVIIENQLEPTDHRHLGQLLTYAAGLDAAVIVWISPEVRDEHREALDWLNGRTDDRIEFFGVALEAISIDQSKPAIQFRPVAFPNAWSKKLGVRAAGAELTERSQRYQQFFQAVIDELRQKYRFTNAQVARPQNWYAFASGTTGILYGGTFAGGSRLRAELYVDMGDASRNKAIFDWLYGQRPQIEQKTGNLEWERLDHRRASRISLVRPDTTIDDFGTQATEMKEWLVQALLKIKSAFGPLLESLPHEVVKA
jgi:hypothetical protein